MHYRTESEAGEAAEHRAAFLLLVSRAVPSSYRECIGCPHDLPVRRCADVRLAECQIVQGFMKGADRQRLLDGMRKLLGGRYSHAAACRVMEGASCPT